MPLTENQNIKKREAIKISIILFNTEFWGCQADLKKKFGLLCPYLPTQKFLPFWEFFFL